MPRSVACSSSAVELVAVRVLLVLTLFHLQTPSCSTFLQFEIVLLLQPFLGSMLRGVLDRHLEGLRSGLECLRVAREFPMSVACSSSAVEPVAVRVLLSRSFHVFHLFLLMYRGISKLLALPFFDEEFRRLVDVLAFHTVERISCVQAPCGPAFA